MCLRRKASKENGLARCRRRRSVDWCRRLPAAATAPVFPAAPAAAASPAAGKSHAGDADRASEWVSCSRLPRRPLTEGGKKRERMKKKKEEAFFRSSFSPFVFFSTSTFSKKKKHLSSPLSLFYTPSLLHAKDTTQKTPCVLSQHAARKKANHTRKGKGEEKTLRFYSVDFGVRGFREQPRFEGSFN